MICEIPKNTSAKMEVATVCILAQVQVVFVKCVFQVYV